MNPGAFALILLLAFSYASAASIAQNPLIMKIKDPKVQHQFKTVDNFYAKYKSVSKQMNLGDLTVECALCGIAVNEVEGFMIENITQQEIMNFVQNDICSLLSGQLKETCDSLDADIPNIINYIETEQSVSVACVELGYCAQPFSPHPDPSPVPTYTINLDLPPQQRWTQVCSNPSFQQNAQWLYSVVQSLLPNGGEYLEEIGEYLNQWYFPTEFGQEIQGCSAALGVPFGWLSLFNLGYEVSDACTSIVAQTTDGKIYHARNMDFWAGMGFTDTLKNITFVANFQKGGQTLFMATSFAGYVGTLSGMKPGAFSITIDTRFYPQGLGDMFYEIIAAIIERNASLVSFLSREVFTNENDWPAALNNLANTELIADVYYILAGVSAGQGAVISRNRHNATNVWILNSPSRWFEVETNYDHWEQPPWFDDRVDPANDGMNTMGQTALSLQGMFNVLSIKPVLNIQTTYSILASPSDGTYKCWTRWCPYPCVE